MLVLLVGLLSVAGASSPEDVLLKPFGIALGMTRENAKVEGERCVMPCAGLEYCPAGVLNCSVDRRERLRVGTTRRLKW
jgi:hypothetical protein